MSVKHVAGTEALCFLLNLCLETLRDSAEPCLHRAWAVREL